MVFAEFMDEKLMQDPVRKVNAAASLAKADKCKADKCREFLSP